MHVYFRVFTPESESSVSDDDACKILVERIKIIFEPNITIAPEAHRKGGISIGIDMNKNEINRLLKHLPSFGYEFTL